MPDASDRIRSAFSAAKAFIGENGRTFRNEAGNLVVVSEDKMREFRFDFNRPDPHEHPHMHIIQYRWIKNERNRK